MKEDAMRLVRLTFKDLPDAFGDVLAHLLGLGVDMGVSEGCVRLGGFWSVFGFNFQKTKKNVGPVPCL